jgi:DeoR/GlpR family transcriptional regulator of sugar metabolism
MLLDALSIHKRLSVTEAAELLGVSAATVRRDFKELARQQLATRTHGGVVATTVAYDLPARYRMPPATRVSGSLMPRPSWSGTERSEMVSQAQRVTVVADSQRIGDAALARICTIDQVDGLVTDDVADPDQVRRLRDAGVDVTLV